MIYKQKTSLHIPVYALIFCSNHLHIVMSIQFLSPALYLFVLIKNVAFSTSDVLTNSLSTIIPFTTSSLVVDFTSTVDQVTSSLLQAEETGLPPSAIESIIAQLQTLWHATYINFYFHSFYYFNHDSLPIERNSTHIFNVVYN